MMLRLNAVSQTDQAELGGSLFSSGGKISVPAIRRAIETDSTTLTDITPN
jgi:hypothetical protein